MSVRPAVAGVALVLASAVPTIGQVTFSSKVEAVRVDVLVTDRGQVVGGLQPADFDVRDNGVRQQVDLVSLGQIPLNVILAFDTSASVSGERLDHLQSAGHTLLDSLTKDDRAALVTFSHVVALRESLTFDVGRVRAALDEVIPLGDTALVDASHAAMMLGDSDAGRNLLIVFSDGLDTSSWLSPDGVLESARRSDVVVYGVAMRGREEPEFLRDISEVTGGAVFEIESTKDLSGTLLSIIEEFRQRYLVSYSPRGVSGEGWHRLDVRINGRRTTVKARAGYQAGGSR